MYTLNVEMITSPLLITLNEDGSIQSEIEWTAQNGIPGTLPTILKEFCEKECNPPIIPQ
jgi:hypothetical protein